MDSPEPKKSTYELIDDLQDDENTKKLLRDVLDRIVGLAQLERKYQILRLLFYLINTWIAIRIANNLFSGDIYPALLVLDVWVLTFFFREFRKLTMSRFEHLEKLKERIEEDLEFRNTYSYLRHLDPQIGESVHYLLRESCLRAFQR